MKHNFLCHFTLFLILSSLVTASLPVAGLAQTGAAPSLATGAAAARYEKALATIEEKVEARRKELGIPGMSLVIVKDGQPIYMKGLGYKDFEKQAPVTADTQFAIGSATKAFTALTVLMAQDAGKLSLDDSPKKYLPYFHMYDPETDKAINIRDLLSHSSGLNRTDLAMITGRLSRAELIEVAAQAKPTAKLREKFQYQNLMFTAAGEIVAQVEGKPWEQVVPEMVFKPLGMTNSTMSIGDMQKAKDHSFGYQYNFDTKETRRLPYREITQVAPAGSINSSARDMGKWLQFVLGGGEINGKRLVSEESFAEWIKPQMKIAPNGSVNYGLGWFLRDWNGMRVVEHGGNIDGFNALVAMIPEKKLGFVMLTNVTGSPLGTELMPIVWENILGKPAGTEGNGKPDAGTPSATADAAAARELMGRYLTPDGNGSVEVKDVDGKTSFVIGGQQPYALEPNGKDTYRMLPLPDTYMLSVKRTADGKVEAVVVKQPEGEFTFKAAKSDEGKIAITADELMAKVIAAGGGKDNIKKIRSRVVTMEVDLENQGVKATGTAYAVAPNKTATVMTMTALGKNIAVGYDFFDGVAGEEAYSFAPASKYTGKRLEDIRIGADLYGMLNWKTNFKRTEIVRMAKCGEDECYVVEFEPEKGTKITEFISTKTFLPVRREGVIPSSTTGQQIPYSVAFEDYREVDGIMIPFKTTNRSPSNGSIVTIVKEVKHNVEIDKNVFRSRKLELPD